MKRSRFTEEQVIAILKEQEAGMKTADVCRKHATFYKYKAKSVAWTFADRDYAVLRAAANNGWGFAANGLTTVTRLQVKPSCIS